MEQEKKFHSIVFKYPLNKDTCGCNGNFQETIQIPCQENPIEVFEKIFCEIKVSPPVKIGVMKHFLKFIQENNEKYYDEKSESYISVFNPGDSTLNKVLDLWKPLYSKNSSLCENGSILTDDSELFSTVYHKLVHSPALETILKVEHAYSLLTQELIYARDQDLADLSSKQTKEMSKAVEGLSLGLTEADITAIANRHLEEHGMQIASWQSKLAGLHESQRTSYREWLMSLLEQSYDDNVPLTPNTPSITQNRGIFLNPETQLLPLLQESFTIHLGSQMKQMYNIRILAADVLDFCKLRLPSEEDMEPQPQRLQTSLGLYSSDLCGLVLLSDNHLGGFSGITKDFIRECETSTELHFNSTEEQIDSIRESVKAGIEWRRCNKILDSNILTSMEQQLRKSSTRYLQTGDVFITKHSNLSEVHVVYHIVVDDTVKSDDITSRHPVILGLRNIMKSACSYDVTTLTLPVLLTHEINNDMTPAWYTRRAELIYKCIKGFMIEMATWGGTELKNLQLLLPKGLNEEIFNSLASMLPCIFRLSNPLILQANSNNK